MLDLGTFPTVPTATVTEDDFWFWVSDDPKDGFGLRLWASVPKTETDAAKLAEVTAERFRTGDEPAWWTEVRRDAMPWVTWALETL